MVQPTQEPQAIYTWQTLNYYMVLVMPVMSLVSTLRLNGIKEKVQKLTQYTSECPQHIFYNLGKLFKKQ